MLSLYLYEKPTNSDDDLFGQQPDATDAHGYTRRTPSPTTR